MAEEVIAKSDYYKHIIRFPRLQSPCDTGDVNGVKPKIEMEKFNQS